MAPMAPTALGTLLHSTLNPSPSAGPPWTHALAPPEPIGEDEDGNPVYPEPGPAMTLIRHAPEQPRADDDMPAGGYWIES